jgi:hypothetical protein
MLTGTHRDTDVCVHVHECATTSRTTTAHLALELASGCSCVLPQHAPDLRGNA